MSNAMIIEVVQNMEKLSDNLQQQALDFVKDLGRTFQRGVPGKRLLRFAGFVPVDELQLMSDAIRQDCG